MNVEEFRVIFFSGGIATDQNNRAKIYGSRDIKIGYNLSSLGKSVQLEEIARRAIKIGL